MRKGTALLMPVVVLVLATCTPPPAVTATDLLSVLSTSAGPAPSVAELTFRQDGSVLYGLVGEVSVCPLHPSPADLARLASELKASVDLLSSVSAARFEESFSDVADVTFILPKPPLPGRSNEISVPFELFPVRLLPLIEATDELAGKACGARYHPVAPRLRSRAAE